jgi:hypothetical protein
MAGTLKLQASQARVLPSLCGFLLSKIKILNYFLLNFKVILRFLGHNLTSREKLYPE